MVVSCKGLQVAPGHFAVAPASFTEPPVKDMDSDQGAFYRGQPATDQGAFYFSACTALDSAFDRFMSSAERGGLT
jgi:hypothetical protein